MTIHVPENATAPRPSEWSPALDETFGSAHADYAELRKTNGFPWSSDFGGFWSALTYDDVTRIVQDDEGFITSVQNVVPAVPRKSPRPPLHIDPPKHGEYRTAIDRVLRRAQLKEKEGEFREAARRGIRELLQNPSPDAVRDFAAPFVIDCFAILIGAPSELMNRVRDIGIRYSFAIQDMDAAVIAECSDQLYDIARTIYRERLEAGADPDTDMVASLQAAADDPTNSITSESALATLRQLIVAGMGAPQAVIASSIVHLAMDQDLQTHLRQNLDEMPAAAEEFLRMHAPYRVFSRTATKDTQIHGRTVRAGEAVALIYPSANRDETVYDNPDEFVLRRAGNAHLTFGRGAHKCPAANMGRMEVAIALEELLKATEQFTLDGEVQMMNWLEYGPKAVPLSLTPARG